MATKTKAAPKAPAARDKFGSKIGNQYAKFNAALSKRPQTMKQLCEKVYGKGNEIAQTFYDHVNKLIAKGYVNDGNEGYSLTGKLPEKKAKAVKENAKPAKKKAAKKKAAKKKAAKAEAVEAPVAEAVAEPAVA